MIEKQYNQLKLIYDKSIKLTYYIIVSLVILNFYFRQINKELLVCWKYFFIYLYIYSYLFNKPIGIFVNFTKVQSIKNKYNKEIFSHEMKINITWIYYGLKKNPHR